LEFPRSYRDKNILQFSQNILSRPDIYRGGFFADVQPSVAGKMMRVGIGEPGWGSSFLIFS
jgi:hypothetical protein